jgi:hypothetical protein
VQPDYAVPLAATDGVYGSVSPADASDGIYGFSTHDDTPPAAATAGKNPPESPAYSYMETGGIVQPTQPRHPVYAEGGAVRIASAPLATDSMGLHAAMNAWIAARTSRAVAEAALQSSDFAPGAFCLRQGRTSPSALVLSVVGNRNRATHFRIFNEPDGSFKLGDTDEDCATEDGFVDVYALVQHYMTTSLSANVPALTGCIPLHTGNDHPAPAGLYAVPTEGGGATPTESHYGVALDRSNSISGC